MERKGVAIQNTVSPIEVRGVRFWPDFVYKIGRNKFFIIIEVIVREMVNHFG